MSILWIKTVGGGGGGTSQLCSVLFCQILRELMSPKFVSIQVN